MSRALCPRKNCGEWLQISTDTLGRVTYRCRACVRNKAGFCRDCSNPRPSPWHMRCAACAKKKRRGLERERDRRRYESRKPEIAERWKRRMQNPEFRARRAKYMADYRRTCGRDHYARVYNRVYMATRRADPTYRKREQSRKRERRALGRAAGLVQGEGMEGQRCD